MSRLVELNCEQIRHIIASDPQACFHNGYTWDRNSSYECFVPDDKKIPKGSIPTRTISEGEPFEQPFTVENSEHPYYGKLCQSYHTHGKSNRDHSSLPLADRLID